MEKKKRNWGLLIGILTMIAGPVTAIIAQNKSFGFIVFIGIIITILYHPLRSST